ncbi:MAG TPA: L,D-transpeptidase family protein [Sphingobacteriaceae bacterium]
MHYTRIPEPTSKIALKSTIKRHWPLFFLFFTIIINSVHCGKKTKGPQPTLDSAYIVEYMRTEPAFKDQTEWAKKFYKEREFKLGWFKDHKLVPEAEKMLGVIARANEEGLNAKDYQVKDFEKLFKAFDKRGSDTVKRNAMEREIDVALSATYFNWASDYYRGIVVPKENNHLIDWDVKRNKIKLHKALATILKERESKYPYDEFKPLHKEYANLKTALARYRKIEAAGGWPQLPAGINLKPGDSSAAVSTLRQRMKHFSAQSGGGNKYDNALVSAVKKFQTENGLKPTGIVSQETVRLLNIPVKERISQIIINMERWRWIPKSFEPDYIMVNIPEYKMKVVQDSQEVMTMKVIVGKELNNTPIFSDKMEYVVLSPYWNIPQSILSKEIAPKLISDPGYLERLDMEVIDAKKNLIDPYSVDWSTAGDKGFKYIVRRRPGPRNDLGDVKFIFPNVDDIYLHDTPNDELFNQTKRGFSHGCVRVEEPVKLAEYLLKNAKGGSWDRASIMRQINSRQEKFVPLKEKLPVYLVYFTAWADASGNVHFRDDIYGHDKVLKKQYFSRI